jgi:positive regulator of sigma E activity
VYGIVLVTALAAAEIEAETDWDVIVFVLGTVGVFWLAHIYAAVVSARGRQPVPRLRTAIWHGVGHSSGMVIAMLIPVTLLATGTLGLLDEWVAYYLALGSGIAILATIGYANARRNASTWPWRLAGVATTTSLGAVVIALSIWAHM